MSRQGWRALLIAGAVSLGFFLVVAAFWHAMANSPAYTGDVPVGIWHRLDVAERAQPCYLIRDGYDIEDVARTMTAHYGGDQDWWVIQLNKGCGPAMSEYERG